MTAPAYFDDKARRWDNNPLFQERANRIAAAMTARVPLNTTFSALDYGCGTGQLSFPLRDRFGHIVLQDTSPGMLSVLREKITQQNISNMQLIQGDLAQPEDAAALRVLAPDGFDLIYSSMTLHHLPDTAAALRRFTALLKPGGWLCLADLDAEDGSFHGPAVDVHHGFERAALQTLAEASGLGEIHFDTVFSIPKEAEAGLRDAARDYPVFLMTGRVGRKTR